MFIQAGTQILRRFDGATVELIRRGGLFVLQCQVVVPMLLAPVEEELAGEAPDLPPVDEEMERELMGREEVEPPVAIEVPAPGERASSWTHELVGENTDMSHDHKTSQAHPSCDAISAS